MIRLRPARAAKSSRQVSTLISRADEVIE